MSKKRKRREADRSKAPRPEIRASLLETTLVRAPFALTLYVVAAFVATWPLLLHVSTKLPMGTEPSPTVVLFNLWTMGWNATWPSQAGAEYWNAPIFHPAPGTFAFADPQPLTGLIATPLWHLSPVLAYNGMLLTFLVLNAWSARSLLVARGFDAVTALFGGLFVQFLPFLAHERGVLQLQPLFPAVWAVDQVWKLAEHGRLRNGLGLGLAGAATFLMSEYLAVFLVMFLLPVVPLLWRELKRSARGLALAAGIGALLVLPVAVPQAIWLNAFGFERSDRTVERFSASASDYLRRSPALWNTDSPDASNKHLSPGVILLVLAGAGAWVGLRSGGMRRRWSWFLLLAGAWALLLSLGPIPLMGSFAPYEAVRWIPGLASLRSPFRFAVFVQLAVALLAVAAIESLTKRRGLVTTLAIACLALIEILPRPSPMVDAPPRVERTDISSPVVFLPFVHGTNAADYFRTTAAMCALLPSGARLVNGYSGYFPELNSQLKVLMEEFPTEPGMKALRTLGVKSLFFELDRMSPSQIQRLDRAVAAGELEPMGTALGVQLARVHGSRLRPASEYRGRWRLEGRTTDTERHIELLLFPTELGSEMYVVSPSSAPLEWRVRIWGKDGVEHEYIRSPLSAVLLHAGDDVALRLRLPRPDRAGDYVVRVLDVASDRAVAEGSVSRRR